MRYEMAVFGRRRHGDFGSDEYAGTRRSLFDKQELDSLKNDIEAKKMTSLMAFSRLADWISLTPINGDELNFFDRLSDLSSQFHAFTRKCDESKNKRSIDWASGFKSEFRDDDFPNADQWHHFAGALKLSDTWGTNITYWGLYWFAGDANQPNDRALASAAFNVFDMLQSGLLNPLGVGTWVRTNLGDD